MKIKKVLENDDPSNLNDYYEKRETTVKLCSEVSSDYYESVMEYSPSIKIEHNNLIQNNFIGRGKIFHEPYKRSYRKPKRQKGKNTS